jgi:hypothetical protein
VARGWIEELKRHLQFTEIPLKPKMIVEFIRSQEKSFEKAVKRARELGIPPPKPVPSIDPFRLELEIEFITGPRTSKQSKSEMDSICHYFNQLYDTLAPLHSFDDRNSCEPPSRPGIEDNASPSNSSPAISLSTVGAASPDEFQFSSGPHSSRSVSETPSLLDITSTVSQNCVQPMLGAKPISIATNDNANMQITESDPAEGRLFTFHTPTFGRAPIPIPIPSKMIAELSRHPAATVNGLSNRFEGLSFRDNNLESNVFGSLQSSPLPCPPSVSSETCSHKRKRSTPRAPLPTIASHYGIVRSSVQQTKAAHKRARIAELETAISVAKTNVPVKAAERCGAFDYVLGKNQLSHEQRMQAMRIQINNLRDEAETFGLFVEPLSFRCLGDRVLRILRRIQEALIYDFPCFLLKKSHIEQITELQQDMEYVLQQLRVTNRIPTKSNRRDVYDVTMQVVRLCQARTRLYASTSSTIPKNGNISQPWLQRRHRFPEGNDPKTVLKNWFNAHASDPYPSKAEKVQLSKQTGMDFREVTRWFTNMRHRVNRGNVQCIAKY